MKAELGKCTIDMSNSNVDYGCLLQRWQKLGDEGIKVARLRAKHERGCPQPKASRANGYLIKTYTNENETVLDFTMK